MTRALTAGTRNAAPSPNVTAVSAAIIPVLTTCPRCLRVLIRQPNEISQNSPAGNTTSNTVQLLTGDGLGGFVAGSAFATGTGPAAVAVADYNGDGLPDLFFSSSVGRNALYRNEGGTRFTDVASDVGVAGPIARAKGAA